MRADESRERQTPASTPDDEMRQAPNSKSGSEMRQDPTLDSGSDMRQAPASNSGNELRQAPASNSDAQRQQVQPVRDAEYEEYLEWRRQRARPFYSKGWFWALLVVVSLVLVTWQMDNIADAVLTNAAATRDQSSAIEEQTQVLRETGSWMVQQLDGIKESLNELVHYVAEAVQQFRSSSNSG